jgi:catechol-2,3-dioxygenase
LNFSLKTLQKLQNSIETLGFEVVTKSQQEVTFKVGTSLLRFTENLALETKYHFAFNIPSNQVESALEWLNKKVDIILDADKQSITQFEDWNAQAIYFYDNNGNILEFIARRDLKDNSSEDFSRNLIRCISEIGLVSNEPLH